MLQLGMWEKNMTQKEKSRQKLLWYSFWFIVVVTLLAFVSAWLDKDLNGINAIVATTISALSLLGIGNLATKPSQNKGDYE